MLASIQGIEGRFIMWYTHCAGLQREIQQLKTGLGSRGSQGQQQHQGNLVSLDSWSQAGNDSTSGGWDAFSNQPEASREPTSQAPASQSSALSPMSPQRQAAAAQAQAFIRTQASNVQSMQVEAVCVIVRLSHTYLCFLDEPMQDQ